MARIRPTHVEISLAAISDNVAHIQSLTGGICPVVKANAYGHGAVEVANQLASQADMLAVSLVEEGVELRVAGIQRPILVMGPALDGGEDELLTHELTPMVSDLGQLQRLGRAACRRGRTLEVHLKIDTGMGRLGIPPSEISRGFPPPAGIVITGLASHFACADTDDPGAPDSLTARQLAVFRDTVTRLRAQSQQTEWLIHQANSAGAFRFPAAHFDMVRPGLAIYGSRTWGSGAQKNCLDTAEHDDSAWQNATIRPAMRFVSAVTQLRTVLPGQSVSYGATWTAQRTTQVAVIPVGYADGYPRSLSGQIEVLLQQTRVPVLGTVSMDMILADVSALDSVQIGDEVVLCGRQGRQEITTSEFAERAGISVYEVTCGLSSRVPRVYV